MMASTRFRLPHLAALHLGLAPAGGQFVIYWPVSTTNYVLQTVTNLASTNWIDLGNAVTATNGSMTASDVIGSDPARFYRVVLLP